MGFKLHQPPSHIEAVNKFMDQMKDILKEAKLKQRTTWCSTTTATTPWHHPSLLVIDSEDIQTTHLSKKLSHCHLGPYPVKRHLMIYAYRLVLPPPIRHLHLVFNVVKLSPAPDDPIAGRCWNLPLPPELVGGEEEYIMEKILNSRMFRWKLQYLVQWEGYETEGNTWDIRKKGLILEDT